MSVCVSVCVYIHVYINLENKELEREVVSVSTFKIV